MGSGKMADFDYDLRQQSIDFQISLISNQSNVLIISPNHDQFTKKLKDEKCTVEIAQINTDKKIMQAFDFKNIENRKFQIILLDNTIDYVPNPVKFIKELNSFLVPGGSLICRGYNIFNAINRIRILNGDIQPISSEFKNRNMAFSSLDNILLTLSEAELSITRLLRVEKEISLTSKLDLNTFTLTEELLKIITADSESKTFYYVFAISNTPTVSLSTRKWASGFSKYLVSAGFKEVLTDYKLSYEKHINYLKQTNREQYALMLNVNDYDNDKTKEDSDQHDKQDLNKNSNSEDNKKFQKELEEDVLEDSKKFLQESLKDKDNYLQTAIKEERKYLANTVKEKDSYLKNALKEKDEYLRDALKEKDEYLEASLKEKDEYLEDSLKDKDKVIRDIQNSFAYRTLRKLDKLLGRKHKKK